MPVICNVFDQLLRVGFQPFIRNMWEVNRGSTWMRILISIHICLGFYLGFSWYVMVSPTKKSGSMQLGRAIHRAHRGCPTDDQESSPVKRCFLKRKHHQILLWGFSCRFILHPMCVPSSRSEHKHFTKTVTSQRKTCVHSDLVEVPGPPRYPWVFIHTLQHHLEFLQMFFLGRNGTQLC